jgi:hypothetical protein
MKSVTQGGHDKHCAIMEAGEHVELISATIVVWCAPGQFCSLHGCRNERSSRTHQDACQDVRACPVPVAAFLRLTCESYSFTPPNPIRNPWLRVHSKPQAARLNPPIAVLTHYALQQHHRVCGHRLPLEVFAGFQPSARLHLAMLSACGTVSQVDSVGAVSYKRKQTLAKASSLRWSPR